jgi:fibronectin-binding autotransporter adhesin
MKTTLQTTLTAALAALSLAAGQTAQAASSTWNGTVSTAWTNAANWNPGIPGVGDDVIIATTTGSGNNLSMSDSRTIGSLLFGDTGGRTAGFSIINTIAANSLTITNGLTANGALGGVINLFRISTIIGADQTWSIGGTPGAVTADSGIGVVPRANGTQTPFDLIGNLTKTGTGQLTFIGANITNNGNLTINQGVVKFNAGSSTTMSASGGGSIIINGGTKLMLFRNSAALTCTKPIVLNSGGTLEFGGNNAAGATYGFPLTLSGNVTLSSGGGLAGQKYYVLSGAWSGNAAINGTALSADVVILVLSNNLTGWTGSLNNAGNGFRIAFASPTPGNAAVAWSLNNAGAVLETFGAANVQLGSLGGNSGTLRNSDPASAPATVTIGALNTSTTFGGVIADNLAALGVTKIGSGSLTLTADNTYSGGTVVSSGTLRLQGAAASVGGGTVSVDTGGTFGGSGSAVGAVNVAHQGTLVADGGTGSPALTVGPLTLGAAGGDSTTNTANVYLGGKVVASSGLTVNGTCTINITGAAPAVGTYDLIQHPGSIGGAGFAGFTLGVLPYGVVAHLQEGATAVQLVVDAITSEPSVWTGTATGTWNLTGTLDWKGATSGTPQSFHNQDVTYFDGSAANLTANIVADVTPSVINVSGAQNQTFTGSGNIIGLGALTKDGTGTLIIANSNTYSGGTFITNGAVQLGDGGTSGSIAGPVENNASLTFNRTDALAVSGPVSGTGSVEQKGAGLTTLGGANTYEGLTTITTGSLAAGTGTAFGITNLGVSVASGATLDLNSQNLGMEPITAVGAGVGGAGAIVNNGAGDQQNATRFVTLTGDTTFGGFRRWDIRNPSAATDLEGGTHAFLLGNGHNLTKTGTNTVALIQVGETSLGNIDIQSGTLTFSRSTKPGNAAGRVTIWPDARLQFHRLNEYIVNPFNKVVSMTNGILAIEGSGLTNEITGPVTLAGSNVVTAPAATGLIITSPIGGAGSLNHLGPNLLRLTGAGTYSGGTTIGGGVLQVDGTLASGATPVFTGNGTLSGTGVLSGAVIVPAGSTLAPGNDDIFTGGIGTLGLGGLTLAPGSTTRVKLNTDLMSHDRVNLATSVVYGGTLNVTNAGFTPYAPGQAFKLFHATSYSGTFAGLLPATPALGLLWDTNTLATDGTLRIIVQPTPRPLVVLSVSSLQSNMINVVFDTEVNQGTALDPSRYTISTGQNVLYGIPFSPTNMQLFLDAPLTSPTYTVQVSGVTDLAYVPNSVTTNVPGRAWDFLASESILITNGYAFAYADKIKIYADGADIFGTSDQFQYVYDEVTGDFDVSVCLESVIITDPAVKAGIMAREIVNPAGAFADDRNYMSAAFSPDPARNNNFVQYREANGGTTFAPGAPRPGATYPTNWLRLKRTGSVMEGFCGPNGLDWTPMTAVDSATNAAGAYPATIRLGLAVTSHNAALTTEAVFHSFGTARVRPALTITPSGSDVIVSWTANGLGWKLEASPSLTTPDANWTLVPGSTSVTTLTLPIGPGQRFFRLVE